MNEFAPLLVADVGNTAIKLAVVTNWLDTSQDVAWKATASIDTAKSNTLETVLRQALSELDTVQAVAYASVAKEMEARFLQALEKQSSETLKPEIFKVDPTNMALPISVGTYPLNQLGADRLVNACQAAYRYPNNPVVVVDFGTATTFDVVLPGQGYQGGFIAPGLNTFWEGLSTRTRLPMVPQEDPPEALGQSTQACLQAGLARGYTGLIRELMQSVEGFVESTRSTVPLMRVATGGLAERFQGMSAHSVRFDVMDSNWTLQGIVGLYRQSS